MLDNFIDWLSDGDPEEDYEEYGEAIISVAKLIKITSKRMATKGKPPMAYPASLEKVMLQISNSYKYYYNNKSKVEKKEDESSNNISIRDFTNDEPESIQLAASTLNIDKDNPTEDDPEEDKDENVEDAQIIEEDEDEEEDTTLIKSLQIIERINKQKDPFGIYVAENLV
jgi:hypothetical protein